MNVKLTDISRIPDKMSSGVFGSVLCAGQRQIASIMDTFFIGTGEIYWHSRFISYYLKGQAAINKAFLWLSNDVLFRNSVAEEDAGVTLASALD